MSKKDKTILLLVLVVLLILCLLLVNIVGKHGMDKCNARQGTIVTNYIGLFKECIWSKK